MIILNIYYEYIQQNGINNDVITSSFPPCKPIIAPSYIHLGGTGCRPKNPVSFERSVAQDVAISMYIFISVKSSHNSISLTDSLLKYHQLLWWIFMLTSNSRASLTWNWERCSGHGPSVHRTFEMIQRLVAANMLCGSLHRHQRSALCACGRLQNTPWLLRYYHTR